MTSTPATGSAPVPAIGRGEPIFTRNFVLLCLMTFSNFGGFYLLLPTLPLYVVQVLGGTEADVGLVMGTFSLAAVLARPPLGKLVDRWGRRAVLVLGTGGMALAGFGFLAAATLLLLLGVRVWQGLAFSGTTAAGHAFAGDIVPSRRRGEALGYYGMSANLALALAPWLALELVRAFGFSTMFVASGLLGVMGVAFALNLREPSRARERVSSVGPLWGLLNRRALPAAAVLACFASAYAAQVAFLPLYATVKQLGDPGPYFTIYAIVLILARAPAGRVSDRFGRGASVVPGLVLATLALLTLSAATSMLWLAGAAVLFATSFALVHPALMALVVDVTRPAERGSAMATFSTAMDVGIGLGSFVWGLVAQQFGLSSLYLAASVMGPVGLAVYAWLVRGKMQPVHGGMLSH